MQIILIIIIVNLLNLYIILILNCGSIPLKSNLSNLYMLFSYILSILSSSTKSIVSAMLKSFQSIIATYSVKNIQKSYIFHLHLIVICGLFPPLRRSHIHISPSLSNKSLVYLEHTTIIDQFLPSLVTNILYTHPPNLKKIETNHELASKNHIMDSSSPSQSMQLRISSHSLL